MQHIIRFFKEEKSEWPTMLALGILFSIILFALYMIQIGPSSEYIPSYIPAAER